MKSAATAWTTAADRRRRSAARWRFAALALLASACGRDPVALSFADHLEHQRDNVTTGLISVPGGVNTHLLEYGWRTAADGEHAELVQRTGRIRFFAAHRELRRLVLRGSMGPSGEQRRYRLLINGRKRGSVAFGPRPGERRVDLPAGAVRRGANLLALRCLECPAGERHRGPGLRLTQLRLLPAAAHRGRVRGAGGPDGESFRMPASAYLDVVAQLPQAAAFRGALSVSGARAGSVTVTLSVLDASGERRAGQWQVDDGDRHSLRADLRAWSGRLVRLRLAAAGEGAAELDWRRAVVTGRGGPPRGGRLPLARPAAPPRSGRLGRPDVLLVLLDAARADAFEPFGGPYPTPALQGLADDGTRFTEAWAPASWTQPSVSALLTGLYPDSLGSDAWGTPMRLQTPTMAELLAAAGYRTVLWHQHPLYRAQRELARGFGETHWARGSLDDPVPPADLTAADDRPTFTLVHLLPPHAPYEPPPPFRGAYSSWYEGDLDVSARALNQFHTRRDAQELDADERRYIRDRYLENAAYADSLVGRIRDRLIERGRYDQTLIVVLSDHGESFLEHGRFLHTQQLYRESIHVPLVAKWPRAAPSRRVVVEQPVSLVDLLPTLVDGLGLETDRGFQGRSLLPIAFDGRPEDRPIWAVTRGATESWRLPAPRTALRYDGWKAVYAPLADRLELYDVAADPAEQRDLAADRPLAALLLRQAVLEQQALNASLRRSEAALGAEGLDAEVEQQLRDLGYLGRE